MLIESAKGTFRVQITIFGITGHTETAVTVLISSTDKLMIGATGNVITHIVLFTINPGFSIETGCAFAIKKRPRTKTVCLRSDNKHILKISGILTCGKNNLFQIVGAGDGSGFGTSLVEGGEQHTGENCNYCNYDKKFDKGETSHNIDYVTLFEAVSFHNFFFPCYFLFILRVIFSF